MINYNGLNTIEHLNYYKWRICRSPMATSFDEIRKHLPPDSEDMFKMGWGNGYIKVDSNSPFYESNIENQNLSQEITYNSPSDNSVIIGFDTGHSYNDLNNSPKEQVLKWTLELYKEIYPDETHSLYNRIDDICLDFMEHDDEYFRIITKDKLFIFFNNEDNDKISQFKRRLRILNLKKVSFDICKTNSLNFLITSATI